MPGLVDSILTDLRRRELPIEVDGLVTDGALGVALLAAYAGGEENAAWADAILADLTGWVAEVGGERPWLFAGFAGIAWALEHLPERVLPPSEVDVCAAVDDLLLGFLANPLRRRWELMFGLSGIAVYLLERTPRPAAVAALEQLIDRLAETAQPVADGILWPDEQIRLGLSHGVAGVIAVLARVAAAGVRRNVVEDLLRGTVRWLEQQRLPAGAPSIFPHSHEPVPVPSRLAWCHGDLGIACALIAAARAVGEPRWEHAAIDVARHAATRGPREAMVVDASLCHGAAGVSHLFRRLHRATGEPTLAAASDRWLAATLAMRHEGEGIGGFLVHVKLAERFEPRVGLLMGSSGIGLCLCAAEAEQEPTWDRLLLVDLGW